MFTLAHDRYENQIKNYAKSRNTLSQDISRIHKNKKEKTWDILNKKGSRKDIAAVKGTMIIPNEKETRLHGGGNYICRERVKKKVHSIHTILYKLREKQVGHKSQ